MYALSFYVSCIYKRMLMHTSVVSLKYMRDLKVVDILYLFDAMKNCLQFKNITRSVEKSIRKYSKIYKIK